jgi:hypothetical protein
MRYMRLTFGSGALTPITVYYVFTHAAVCIRHCSYNVTIIVIQYDVLL